MLWKNKQIPHVLANNSMLKWWTEKSTELASSRITSEASWFVNSGFPTVQTDDPFTRRTEVLQRQMQWLP